MPPLIGGGAWAALGLPLLALALGGVVRTGGEQRLPPHESQCPTGAEDRGQQLLQSASRLGRGQALEEELVDIPALGPQDSVYGYAARLLEDESEKALLQPRSTGSGTAQAQADPPLLSDLAAQLVVGLPAAAVTQPAPAAAPSGELDDAEIATALAAALAQGGSPAPRGSSPEEGAVLDERLRELLTQDLVQDGSAYYGRRRRRTASIATTTTTTTTTNTTTTTTTAAGAKAAGSATPHATPAPEATPAVKVSTNLTENVSAGATALNVISQEGFSVGDTINISGGGNSETRTIVDFGSILLDDKVNHSYPANSSVTKIQAAVSSTTVESAADLSGVKKNAKEDLWIFVYQLLINSAVVMLYINLFSILRPLVPKVYQEGPSSPDTPRAAHVPGGFAWMSHAYRLSVDQIAERAGLDQAQLVDFARMGEKITTWVGGPLMLVLAPLHALAGGNAAGSDSLSWLGLQNVQEGSWVFWVHAFATWYVVLVSTQIMRRHMKAFMPRRIKWLKEMPPPRNNTVLIEGIPDGMNTEAAMQWYFDHGVFAREAVKEIHVVKDLTHSGLPAMIQNLEKIKRSIAYRRDVPISSRADGESKLLDLQVAKRTLEAQLEKQCEHMMRDDDVNSRSCFVTFARQQEATVVARLLDKTHEEDMVASLPPDPSDVIWEDLLDSGAERATRTVLGYACLVILLFAFMPITAFIASISKTAYLAVHFDAVKTFRAQHKNLATTWDGMVGSLALQLMMGFLPTLMALIGSLLFRSKASAWLQLRIHEWYFYFLVVFVLLVTTLGTSILETFEAILDRPEKAFPLLANSLPKSTHFYLNYMTLQWGVHALCLLRAPVLAKFVAYKLCSSDDEARSRAEPEDQDYYGIGSRSARFTLTLLVALVFSTLSPLILPVALVNFSICRFTYSYLVVHAETKKPDLGGEFFVSQLHHLHSGLYLFIVLMYSVLLVRAKSWMPCWLTLSCTVYNAVAKSRLQSDFSWQLIPFEQLDDKGPVRKSTRSSYQQPELAWYRKPVPAQQERQGFLQRVFHHGQDMESLHGQQEDCASVVIVSATNLPAADDNGLSDPYVRGRLRGVAGSEFHTEVKKQQLNPTWMYHHILPPGAAGETLELEVVDSDRFNADESLGRVSVPLSATRCRPGQATSLDLPLSGGPRQLPDSRATLKIRLIGVLPTHGANPFGSFSSANLGADAAATWRSLKQRAVC